MSISGQNDDAIFFASLIERGVPPFICKILLRRGLSEEEAYSFVFDGLHSLHSPFIMEQMTEAVELLRGAVASKSTVGIFCDSDLDGITSLAVMHSVLSRLGVPLCVLYPDGKKNHYGLSKEIISDFSRKGVSLLLTLDCGIRDRSEISFAKESGIEVIVCDHHEPDELPDCAVVNPKASRAYPFRDLAGAGVALKLAQALLFSYLPLYGKTVVAVKRMMPDELFSAERSVNLVVIDKTVSPSLTALNEFIRGDHAIYIDIDERALHAGAAANYELISSSSLGYDKKFINELSATQLLSSILLKSSKKIAACFDEIFPLAAIGTVADIVPLAGENRVILREGLSRFAEVSDERLALLRGRAGGSLTSKTIAWEISPLLNSPGRLACPELTVDFFMKRDAAGNFQRIEKVNEQRKSLVSGIFDKVVSSGSAMRCGSCVYIEGSDIPEGLTGLLATRFSEHFSSPACVVSCAGEGGTAKGSGRSAVPMLAHLEKYQSIFERFGGHENALGFSIAIDNLALLRQALASFEYTEPSISADNGVIEIPYQEINFQLMADLVWLEPYGASNPFPVFNLRDVPVRAVNALKGVHLKALTDLDFQEIIAWNRYSAYEESFKRGRVSFQCTPELSTYNGRKKICLIVKSLI